MVGSSVLGRESLVPAISRQWMFFPQLQIGARKVLDMATEAIDIVLFDHERTEGGVNLGVALSVEHGDLLFRMPTIS
jgi:hypothetical protein